MNSFIFISVLCSCLLLYSAWTDGREGYIPDQVSILIFVLSLFSVLNGYGPGFLIRIAGAFFCGGLLELIRLISKGGIGMGDVKLMTACGFYLGIVPGILDRKSVV